MSPLPKNNRFEIYVSLGLEVNDLCCGTSLLYAQSGIEI
jgi:hypothetical protein